jgi:hypothetical protein
MQRNCNQTNNRLEILQDNSNSNSVRRLVNFATSKELLVKSNFKHKKIHKQIWVSADRYISNQIDHGLVNSRQHTNSLEACLHKGTSKVSDHFMIIGELRDTLLMKRTWKGKNWFERFDTEKMKTNHWKDSYQVEVLNMFEALKKVTKNLDEIGVEERIIEIIWFNRIRWHIWKKR